MTFCSRALLSPYDEHISAKHLKWLIGYSITDSEKLHTVNTLRIDKSFIALSGNQLLNRKKIAFHYN